MKIPLKLSVDARSPIPIRRQLTEQLKHVIEAGGVPRDQPLPSIRELAGVLGINANTVARVIDDLKLCGYVDARRGKGVFVVPVPPVRPLLHLRERLLEDVLIRAAALGMTADDVAVGVLSVATRPTALHEAVDVLVVECSSPELAFFSRQLEDHLPVRLDNVLLRDLPKIVRDRKRTGRWRVAVTSFSHLPDVERLLRGRSVPVIALLAEARLDTLHALAQLPPGAHVGVVSGAGETTHSIEHSIANAGLPNITIAGVCAAEGAGLRRLVRRVDAIVCPTPAAERVRALAGSTVQVIVDDRALAGRGIEMLAGLLVRRDGVPAATVSPPRREVTRLDAGTRTNGRT